MTTDLFGLTLNRQELPLSPDDIEALQEKGIPVPDPAVIVFEWREANAREREKYAFQQRKGWKSEEDARAWMADLLMKRAAEGTDRRVLVEFLAGLGVTQSAMLTHAYLMGEMPDPKLTAGAIQKTLTGQTNGLLGALASLVYSPS